MAECKHCGAETTPEDHYCPGCGKRIVLENENQRGSTQGVVTLSDVKYKLGMVYFKKGDYARAIGTWQQVLKDEPDHPEANKLIQEAQAQLEKGNAGSSGG